MKISTIGLGNLGYPLSEFLSATGYKIKSYDKNYTLKNTLFEKHDIHSDSDLYQLINNGNDVEFYYDISKTLYDTEVCFITVPTPSKKDGSFDNSYILDVLDKISKNFNLVKKTFIIVINSTISPNSIDSVFIPFMSKNGLKNNKDYMFVYNPYFVALGEVTKNLKNPDLILLGSENKIATNKLKKIYSKILDDPKFKVLNFLESELVKLLLNTYLTMKISFSNVVKNLCDNVLNIDAHRILDTIGTDKRINKNFLKVGGPFSGPCLPRDNQAILNYCKKKNVKNEISIAAIKTNNSILRGFCDDLKNLKNKKIKSIGFLGLGYKSKAKVIDGSFIPILMKTSKKINLKIFLYDHYLKNIDQKKLNRCNSLEEVVEKSDIIFLPYIDKIFNKLNRINSSTPIIDIWNQIHGPNVYRNISEFNNKFNKKSKNNVIDFYRR